MLIRPTHCVFISLLAFTISSCGSNPIKSDAVSAHTKTSDARGSHYTSAEKLSPSELMTRAQQKKSPERENLLLQAAEIYIEQKQVEKAQPILKGMNASQLPNLQFVTHSQLSGSMLLKTGEVEQARRILTNLRLEQQLNALDPNTEAALRELRAEAFELNGQLPASIAERISLTAVLTDSQASNANQDALWQTLMLLPLTTLQENARKGSGGITQGWYALAAVSKNNTQDIASQKKALAQWLTQWRHHPAAFNLPADLRALQSMNDQPPQKIALLLPLQGRLAEAGEAVRDGFFANYYSQVAQQHTLPTIRQYDTSKDVIGSYQQAINDGADLVIGPLDKEDVNKISRLAQLPTPVLTLNYPDQQPSQPIGNLYQFGLAVEDEARQAARQAIQDGHRYAVIVSSLQDVNERAAQAFANEWQKLGGTIVGKCPFVSQTKFSESFRSVMLIDESESRHAVAQQQLATKFEFTPRRRADVDMIFMAATPTQGRQIIPTFIYHFANNIPVYATSSIYSGDADSINNEDLNGVLFNTLPWVFDTNNIAKLAIAQNSKSSAVYGRLHALGADAFNLYARLGQLKRAPDMKIYGATGSLQLLSDGRIEREQLWARFNKGLAEPIVSTADVLPKEAQE